MKELTTEEKIILGRREYQRRLYHKNKEHRRMVLKKSQDAMYLRIYEEMQHEQPKE